MPLRHFGGGMIRTPSLIGTVVIDTASDAGSWDRHIRLTGYLNHSINNPPHLIPDEVSKASNRAGFVNHHGEVMTDA